MKEKKQKLMTTKEFVEEAGEILKFLKVSGLLSHSSPYIKHNAQKLSINVESEILMPFNSPYLINWQELYDKFQKELNELKRHVSKRSMKDPDPNSAKSQKTTKDSSPQKNDYAEEENLPESFLDYARKFVINQKRFKNSPHLKTILDKYAASLIENIDNSPLSLEEKKLEFELDFCNNLKFLQFTYKYKVKKFFEVQKNSLFRVLKDNINNDQIKFIFDYFEGLKNINTEDITPENINEKLKKLPGFINDLLADLQKQFAIHVELKIKEDGEIEEYVFANNNLESSSNSASVQPNNKANINLANDSEDKVIKPKEVKIIENMEKEDDKSISPKLEHIEICENIPEVIKENQKHVLKTTKKHLEYSKKHILSKKTDWTKGFDNEKYKELSILKIQIEAEDKTEKVNTFESLPQSCFEYIPEILSKIDLQEYIKKSLGNYLSIYGESGIDFSVSKYNNLLGNMDE